jgi:16S rRNA (cytosine967-C5)-methyltransferase
MSETVNLRAVVLDVLIAVCEQGEYSHIVLAGALGKYQYLEKNDRSFITRLAQGTIEKQIYIDYVIDSFSKVPVAKMKPLIRNLLRMSVYQILFMDKVPDSAAINEAVKLAAKRSFGELKGFVNGVLRNIARNKCKYLNTDAVFEELCEKASREKAMSVCYSMPEWIIEQLEAAYGPEKVQIMLNAMEKERPTYVQCNTALYDMDDIIKELENDNVTVKRCDCVQNALEISDYDYIGRLTAFEKGMINVQDLSSMLVTYAAEPKVTDNVIDVCAAPGGKSIHMAIALNNKGSVTARDISENKVSAMQDTFARMGLSNLSCEVRDALEQCDEDISSADIVLCDAPCSGLGIIARKADIKYKMTPEKQKELAKLQKEILRVSSAYVKKGGTFIFSTCTINKLENEENVKWIQDNLGLEPVDITHCIPEAFLESADARCTAAKGYIQLLPGITGKDNCSTDGFFISRFRKL